MSERSFGLREIGKPDAGIREVRTEAISPLTDFSFDFPGLRVTPVDAKKPD